jgi:hypothetical protein
MIIFNEPQITYKFTKKFSGIASDVHSECPKKVQITLSEEPDLEELLETFQDFLIACGFFLAEDEKVAIIKETEEEEDSEENSENEE